jgi:EAL domain-containing protein (putative c-di-GMP-specific phosphodiesterase class I)/GGDEF domain-containing protein
MTTRTDLFEAIALMVGALTDDNVCAVLIARVPRYGELAATFGYRTLDRVEDAMQDAMQRALRAVDSVHRVGEGAFAILLPDLKASNLAALAAVRLAAALEQPFEANAQRVLAGITIGIAIAPEHGTGPDALCRNAERACVEAARLVDRFKFFTPTADALTLTDADLRMAIALGHLELALQPIHAIDSGRLAGAEALARWQHGASAVPPARFVQLAEQSGSIGALTHWSLNTALRHAATARARNPELFFAVNISPHVLRQPDFVEQVVGALSIWGVPGTGLELEVTESSLMEDPSHSARVLSRLRDHGIRIAIDDFGTGYSSFAYLRQLPATELKIDISFVSALSRDERVAKVVRSMIAVAHQLDMLVIAEGVEDATTLERLREMKCDLVQGHYMGMPIPAADFVASLAAAAA